MALGNPSCPSRCQGIAARGGATHVHGLHHANVDGVQRVWRVHHRRRVGQCAVVPVVRKERCAVVSVRIRCAGGRSGRFAYVVPPNSTPAARTTNLVVTTSSGATATHAISEDRPVGCSYVTQPDELVFAASGGTGQFNVTTTPGDCQWRLVNGMSALGVTITSGFSGTGAALVRYSVQAHTRSVDADGYLEIAGLSGLNPNGRHHVVVMKR